jgi:hypothetical protein
VQSLGNPLSDAIHSLEADRPLLSQVNLVFETLLRGALTWVAGLPEVSSLSLTCIFVFPFQAHVLKSFCLFVAAHACMCLHLQLHSLVVIFTHTLKCLSLAGVQAPLRRSGG